MKTCVLLTNSSLVLLEKYILKKRNKYITRFCCEVIIVKVSAILSSTILLFLKVCYIHIYIYIYRERERERERLLLVKATMSLLVTYLH